MKSGIVAGSIDISFRFSVVRAFSRGRGCGVTLRPIEGKPINLHFLQERTSQMTSQFPNHFEPYNLDDSFTLYLGQLPTELRWNAEMFALVWKFRPPERDTFNRFGSPVKLPRSTGVWSDVPLSGERRTTCTSHPQDPQTTPRLVSRTNRFQVE